MHLLSAHPGPGAVSAGVGEDDIIVSFITSAGTKKARASPGPFFLREHMIEESLQEISSPAALIGRTPLVRLRRLEPRPGVEIYAKLESQNPGGSVKDRAALAMIVEGERTGALRRGRDPDNPLLLSKETATL